MPELDELRHLLRISKRKLCLASELCPSTYQRWMRHFQGLPGGSAPQPRSVRVVREVLKRELAGVPATPASPVPARPAA